MQAALVGVPPLGGLAFPAEAGTPTGCHAHLETEEPIAALATYFVIVTVLGLWTARHVKNMADFVMPRKFGKTLMIFYGFGSGTHSDQAVSVASKSYLPWQMIFYLDAGLLAGIAASMVSVRPSKEKLDRFYALVRTPVQPGEVVDAPCTCPWAANRRKPFPPIGPYPITALRSIFGTRVALPFLGAGRHGWSPAFRRFSLSG